jgi:hypothetical protein
MEWKSQAVPAKVGDSSCSSLIHILVALTQIYISINKEQDENPQLRPNQQVHFPIIS